LLRINKQKTKSSSNKNKKNDNIKKEKKMADEKKKNEELTDEELNNAAGGFVLTPTQMGVRVCAAKGCNNRFLSRNGETLCESCRKKKNNLPQSATHGII
jgi:hypothetical protein